MYSHKLFISISVSNTNENRPDEIMLRDMVVEISRYILNAGGKILYGGSGSHDGYVNLFSQISEKYGKIIVYKNTYYEVHYEIRNNGTSWR